MNSLDITVLVIMAIVTMLGIYWGLLRQVLAIVGLLAGVAVAGRYGTAVAAWLSSFIADDAVVQAAGFLLVVLGVSAAASLVASLLRLFVGLLFLGWLDHLLGGILGLAQGVLASAVLIVALVTFPAPAWNAMLAESRLAPPLLSVGEPVTLLLPEAFRFAVQTMLGN